MNTCPEQIVHYMHEYLDGEISREHELELKSHLQSCVDCQAHMHELSDVVAFVKGAAHVEAPSYFTESVMARLPKEKSMLVLIDGSVNILCYLQLLYLFYS